MKLTIEVDDASVATEIMESLQHEAESIGIVHPGTANMLRGVADQIENQIEDAIPETGEKTKVFNVANLKEQMQENVLAILDGSMSTLTEGVRNAILGQVCQVILDTIEPPTDRPFGSEPETLKFIDLSEG